MIALLLRYKNLFNLSPTNHMKSRCCPLLFGTKGCIMQLSSVLLIIFITSIVLSLIQTQIMTPTSSYTHDESGFLPKFGIFLIHRHLPHPIPLKPKPILLIHRKVDMTYKRNLNVAIALDIKNVLSMSNRNSYRFPVCRGKLLSLEKVC